MRPRLLDLFCGAGGCSMGYHRAGFNCTGVDHRPMPRYPFPFIQADAMEYLAEHGREYDVIHSSPPCQAYSALGRLPNARRHPRLIEPLRDLLEGIGRPYVIENVMGAPLRFTTMLCGSMFGLRSQRGYLQRHRLFECHPLVLAPSCQHRGVAVGVWGHGQAGLLDMRMRTANKAEAMELMAIDWMTRDELAQAIPPAYTEFIGQQLLAQATVVTLEDL